MRILERKETSSGAIVWVYEDDDGKAKTIRTSPSTVRVIDEATLIYAGALRRLAKL